MSITATLIHAGLVVAALAAYIVLTVAGHDGTPVFVFIAGQGVGAGVQAAAGKPPQV